LVSDVNTLSKRDNMKREVISSKLSFDIQNILTQELECYRRLVELSEQQQCFIHLRDTDALMSIIAQKEDLISNISRLEIVLQHIFRRFPIKAESACSLPQLSERMPESVKRLINKITAILERLTTFEKESESRLIAKYNEIKKELGNLKQTKTILKTYVPQKTYRPRFIDKET